jgi:hypothetical protein
VEIDPISLYILVFLFLGMGFGADEIGRRIKNYGRYIIGKVYQERGEDYFMLKEVHIGIGQDMFNVGEHQFAVDPEKVRFYEQGHPVQQFDLRDSRPPDIEIKPFDVKVIRNIKPSSATTNLLYRRGGLKAMMMATKGVTMNPILVGALCGVAAFAIGFMVFNFIHPGFVTAPPPGYFYEAKPIPINATVVHG